LTIDGQRSQRPPEPQFDSFPGELRLRPFWVGWVYEIRGSKSTKVPVQPNGSFADVSDPTTWSPLDYIQIAYDVRHLDGVGYVLRREDGVTGCDFDHCLDETGRIADSRIAAYVSILASYTEISPSGRGLRILIRATLPPRDRRIGGIEMYDDRRFVSITGNRFPDTSPTVNYRQREIEMIHSHVFRQRAARRLSALSRPPANATPISSGHDDFDLLDCARRAKNGARFAALYDRGDWQGGGFPSRSEADLWLCARLMFWCGGNAMRVDRLFRQSALYREKWNRPDYRERTLAQASVE
jgi:primase-polymerase (primpol)-like protein